MSRTKIILNPHAGRGYAAAMSSVIRRNFEQLGVDFELVHTRYAGDAIALAQQAAEEGFERVVSVGGDGTTHEVINGLLAAANGSAGIALGCIPAGSGNDFAVMNGVPTQIDQACRLIAEGASRPIDLGKLTVDGALTRYFDNAVGIGFDGLVTMEARRHKRLRGMALYLPVVLKTIFLTMRPPRVSITIDDHTFDLTVLMVVICNGPREGGGFLLAPQARFDDGLFDVLVAETLSKMGMLALVPRFLKGTHLSHERISLYQGKRVVVTSDDPLYFHVDGEMLADEAHRIEIEMIPNCVRMIAGPPRAQAAL
jgi:YegS/Rv2252/BmrU family lipid kinase